MKKTHKQLRIDNDFLSVIENIQETYKLNFSQTVLKLIEISLNDPKLQKILKPYAKENLKHYKFNQIHERNKQRAFERHLIDNAILKIVQKCRKQYFAFKTIPYEQIEQSIEETQEQYKLLSVEDQIIMKSQLNFLEELKDRTKLETFLNEKQQIMNVLDSRNKTNRLLK